MGAHIDSVLGAPGAHDDASGNGATMEMARVLSQFPLDKEIRVGGFGGEEDGLVGARAYVANDAHRRGARPLRRPLADGHGRHAVRARRVLGAGPRTGRRTSSSTRPTAPRRASASPACRTASSARATTRRSSTSASPPRCSSGSTTASRRSRGRARRRPFTPDYTTEPEYHRPTDGMNNISQERLQTALNVVGGAAIHNAFNKVTFTVTNGSGQPVAGAKVTGDCGDGVRNLGESGAGGVARGVRPARDVRLQGRQRQRGRQRRRRGGRRRPRAGDAAHERHGRRRRHRARARCRWRSARRRASARSRRASRGTTSRRRPRT